MNALMQDVRYAVRSLRRTPGFTLVAVLTLALGIGANAAIFSVVNALLLRDLPWQDAGRIVLLSERSRAEPSRQGSTSWLNYEDWRAQARSFESIGILQHWQPALTGAGEAERIEAAIVTSGVLDVFRLAPAAGRLMVPSDNVAGAPMVAMVSHGFWQRRLGGRASAIGRSVTLNGRPVEVVGVMPAGFQGPGELDAELWASNAQDPRDTRGSRYLRVVARLAPGATVETASAELSGIAARLANAYPTTNAGIEAVVTPLRDRLVGDARRPLFLLLGAALLVLLIGAGNLSNLLIVRGLARGREFALRTALGASRGRAMRQLLAEAGVLAVSGGGVGLLLAVWITPLLVQAGPESLRVQPVVVDLRLAVFALLMVSATAALAGLIPAIRVSKVDLGVMLKEGVRESGSRSATWLRSAVSVGQVAIALALLCGAALLIRSFQNVVRVDSGIRPDSVLAMSMNLPSVKYPEGRQPQFFNTLTSEVNALPGIRGSAITSIVPFGGEWDRVAVDLANEPQRQGVDRPQADRYIVGPSYHAVMGIELKEGRLLADTDTRGAPLVALVDEVFARRLAPGGSAVGLRVRLPGARDSAATIVGVVGHVKHYGLDADSKGQVYMSHDQFPWRYMNLVVRTAGDPLASAAPVRAVVRRLDAEQPVFGIASMESLMGERTATRRFVTVVLGLFAVLAAGLAILGLYGVIAYAVSQRTREIGIRLALGAEARQVAAMVVRRGAALASAGVLIGLVVSLVLTGTLSALLFGVSARDPMVFAVVAAGLGAVALLASWLPARRAARTDPMVALRSE